ncbi:hypothetical protein QQ056_08550 [Oscillatoria laete-virens NRMC-F 0139]|nr:hypothetical protein [Oscillatoria laete-virens NRMC-F 0139]
MLKKFSETKIGQNRLIAKYFCDTCNPAKGNSPGEIANIFHDFDGHIRVLPHDQPRRPDPGSECASSENQGA